MTRFVIVRIDLPEADDNVHRPKMRIAENILFTDIKEAQRHLRLIARTFSGIMPDGFGDSEFEGHFNESETAWSSYWTGTYFVSYVILSFDTLHSFTIL